MSSVILNTHFDVYPAIDPSNYTADQFAGKVVVVTGSGSGIGKETALAFSGVGAKVAFTDIRLETAQRAADEAKQFGNPTIAVAGDVTKIEDMERLAKTVVAELGEVDIAVFGCRDWTI